MRRREFISLLGSAAAAWPLPARAQQPARPVIGFINSSSAGPNNANVGLLDSFQQGLGEGGYVEGRNLNIEYRWAGGQYDQLPVLLADLIRRQVKLIVASGGLITAVAAKAATNTVPILFIAGSDPVKVGLVPSLSRPGGNATGVSIFTTALAQKRLQLLLQLVPKATRVALLLNPRMAVPEIEIKSMQDAASHFGLKLLVLEASAESDFEPSFDSAARSQADVLSVSADAFFTPRRAQIIELANRHRLPAVYPWREYVVSGGLMSYGPTLNWAY
jgi:putative ABC transport system substrate-binding protein